MILKAITTSIRWWAKHPWIVFWGTVLFFIVISFALVPLHLTSVFVRRAILLLFTIVLILSFFRGTFLLWQRSKIGTVLIVVVIPVYLAISLPGMRGYRTRTYDAEVKTNLREAALAQKAYFKDNRRYTSTIGSLKGYGFNQSSNVTIATQPTETSYVIAGKVTTGCEADTGMWLIDITTNTIDGAPCR